MFSPISVFLSKPLQKTVTGQEAILTVFWARVVSHTQGR